LHSDESVHAAAGDWSPVNARCHCCAEVVVVHLMEMIEVVKVMEVMEVVEAIDKDESHACADEQRWPPIPRVGIGVGRDRVPHDGTVRVLHDLPCPVRLQARTPDHLLYRAVDFCLRRDRAASPATLGWRG
jgi:hypothetical protein